MILDSRFFVIVLHVFASVLYSHLVQFWVIMHNSYDNWVVMKCEEVATSLTKNFFELFAVLKERAGMGKLGHYRFSRLWSPVHFLALYLWFVHFLGISFWLLLKQKSVLKSMFAFFNPCGKKDLYYVLADREQKQSSLKSNTNYLTG